MARTNAPAPTIRYPVITPIAPLKGYVFSVNPKLRFAIVDFGFSPLPQLEQRLGVFRRGQKVGEVRISGPVSGTSVVADIMAGEAGRGDEVRPE